MNAIRWTSKAARQLRKLDRQIQRNVVDAVSALSQMPDCANVKALSGHAFEYRLRIGGYRVLFDWCGNVRIVDIQEVKKRDERTY
ncbi:type II toxin-antitoxin system RelE family toxin [Herbaspirillum sp. alder98]|uniref:type II toxin-antitoxin system RelE family toxin n=1 Tax=Herbaspirillum sp. alder98 TaxID=2913096 RepID=UPI001CD8F6C8|nr:type II toxin-antitoxin system RelE/ParE family toxin [Herbaspirillum sp. alder98]MCA1322539.1 type II toxin-antitoxin system RelE/ParE family toxin [Herbaspirillum sp. alder98]